jgi:hypothetical protein
MKRHHLLWAALCMGFLLAGCELVFQAGTGLSGQAREDYLKSIKSYGEHWVKEGMTVEGKREDSWACGAARTVYAADHVVFWAEQVQAEKRPEDKNDIGAQARLRKVWAECMKAKGYRYEK